MRRPRSFECAAGRTSGSGSRTERDLRQHQVAGDGERQDAGTECGTDRRPLVQRSAACQSPHSAAQDESAEMGDRRAHPLACGLSSRDRGLSPRQAPRGASRRHSDEAGRRGRRNRPRGAWLFQRDDRARISPARLSQNGIASRTLLERGDLRTALDGRKCMNVTKIEVPTADGNAEAYLYRPSHGSGPWPGVIFLTDIMGIREANLGMAERIAEHGYVVLVPNIFHRVSKLPVVDFELKMGDERTMKRLGELRAGLSSAQMGPD